MNNDEDSATTEVAPRLPYDVAVEPHVPVTLADGCRISVKLWLPQGAPGERFPAVLEAIPYRKDDNSLVDDESRYGYLAGHGYVGVRMDLRGSGTSSGVLADEYSAQEHRDVYEVLDWISRQPWCTGAVAMTGISWSGFNSLQVAALHPPALRTVITVCSTDDRYDNDVHYLGGSLLAVYQDVWASNVHLNNSQPPDPALVGDAWRAMWLERLHHNAHHGALWTQHQRRDDYWRHGSVGEDPSAIDVPVLLVGGWQDPYTDAVFRLVEALGPGSRALVGPWAHTWPERPVPGPAIGYLQECVRWLDRWLKNESNGVDDDPRIRFFVQDSVPTDAFTRERAGRWYAAPSTPGVDGALVLHPSPDLALGLRPAAGTVTHSSPLLLGRGSRHYEPMGGLGDLPDTQTRDDADALSFTTPPLDEELVVYGQPVVRLRLASDRPQALVFARLTDVDDGGESFLVTRGNLNLTHRLGHDREVAPVPVGELLDLEIPLKHIAQRFPAGRRLRLSLSTSYWPWLWPSPERATVTLDLAHCELVLPRLDPAVGVPLERPWERPLIAAPPAVRVEAGVPSWTWEEDTRPTVVRRIATAPTTKHYPGGLTTEAEHEIRYLLDPDDPLSAAVETDRRASFAREGWHVQTVQHTQMTCDADSFTFRLQLTATHDGVEVYVEDLVHRIPRDHT
ncbi:CocE/NonD family hydrolase [Nocardioides anomalus]|uniref:CocE/NonD family hydrolase n=1 Tax=Nocardioides anomalus TaxID=2712223 RepID=A0A6G6W9N1_9ACTN|nr:CocE/NonD family hydrolase [Nocardioides anomalus]QIG41857.1 CocE/NonD family hydrolase [Nocardioides anomalus]